MRTCRSSMQVCSRLPGFRRLCVEEIWPASVVEKRFVRTARLTLDPQVNIRKLAWKLNIDPKAHSSIVH